MSLLLALVLAPAGLATTELAQVGPVPLPGAQRETTLPPEILEREPREQAPPPQTEQAPVRAPAISPELAACLSDVEEVPGSAIETAETWLDEAEGVARVEARQCLGMALSQLGQWAEAQEAFATARDDVPVDDPAMRARLGAMAGNAALAADDAEAALAILEAARADAGAATNAALAGDIAIDLARALVMLGRDSEAEAALTDARAANPGDAQAWLLSATLSRRLGKLDDAQKQIEQAAELLPIDPEIGLEAGVIAMLAGREEAARKSWQSVIGAAPESPAAETARGYLSQLGPAAPEMQP